MVAKNNDEGLRAQPGIDPYEIEWPDDAKELRAHEREEAARAALVKPAPRALTAAVLGIGMVITFIMLVTLVMGDLALLVSVAWPIVAAGVFFALPLGMLLERVSVTWRRGLPEIVFLVVGMTIGITWTHGGLLLLEANTTASLFEDPADMAYFRMVAGIFMGTATASGFMAAKFWTDGLRKHPRVVYVGAFWLAALTIGSVIMFVS